MSANNGTKIWQWLVGLLVLCNIVLIVMMWLKPHREGPPHGGQRARERIINELKFSEEQVNKYEPLIQEHQQAMGKLRHEGNQYRESLYTNLKTGMAGVKTADSFEELIAGNQKRIEMVTYDHFAKVRELCTESQKLTFDKIIGDVVIKMYGPGGHRPPPPGGRRHDGPPPEDDRQGPPPEGEHP
jgi:protein CpxP